jgi:hypothetical protein
LLEPEPDDGLARGLRDAEADEQVLVPQARVAHPFGEVPSVGVEGLFTLHPAHQPLL